MRNKSTSMHNSELRTGTRLSDRIAPVTQEEPFSVLLIVEQTGAGANGGVESATLLMKNLKNIDVTVVTQAHTPYVDMWRSLGFEVHVWPLPASGDLFSPLSLVRYVRFIAHVTTLARSRRIKAIHCNDIAMLRTAVPAARLANVPLVLTIRDTPPTEKWRLRWRLLARAARKIVVLSHDMEVRALAGLRLFGTAPPIEVVYSIVEPPQREVDRDTVRLKLGIEEHQFAIGYVAAFNEKKAQLDFIRNSVPALAEYGNIQVLFIGDWDPAANEYAKSCFDAVEALGLEAVVRFVGYDDDMGKWYTALDLVVLASRREGLARCMIESIAHGTPVVSFDVSSAREILETHKCGVVIEQGDYSALANAIIDLSKDASTRAELGARGIQASKILFTPEVACAAYSSIYRLAAE